MRPDGTFSMSNANGFSSLPNGSTAPAFRKTALSSPLNGHSPSHSTTNGQPQRNGSAQSPSPPFAPSYYGHDREEVTRILIQSLFDLGYEDSATTLSRESGYDLESAAVAAFRSAVIEGRWADAENILPDSYLPNDQNSSRSIMNGRSYNWERLLLADGADKNELLFCLRQQKYLELLQERDVGSALTVLRQELTPLNHDVSQLHALSSLLMCPPEHLQAQSGWEGTVEQSRQKLLSELAKSISPSVMIPDHRLAILLDHVKQNQINQCLYHNTAVAPSLYSDHLCNRNQFPLQTELQLHHHEGEVWYVEFSHDGSKLATTGQDSTVVIYDTATFSILQKLSDHNGSVVYASWSPDDSKLVSCSRDNKARLWDTDTGLCLLTIDHHNEPVTSASWAPDGESFVTSSLDSQAQLCHWSVHGQSLHNWPSGYRAQDCAISPDGRHLAAISTEKKIYVYNFLTREEEYCISFKMDLTCINISHDSRYMLVNMSDSEVQLLDIETAEVVRRFMGQKQGEFIIRSTFGGAAENFVVSGSEDSRIYIWHKENSTLVETLEGHSKGRTSGCVNAVAWNPTRPGMFASAGDDQTVRIWTRGSPAVGNSVVKRGRTLSNGHTRTSALRSTYDPTDIS